MTTKKPQYISCVYFTPEMADHILHLAEEKAKENYTSLTIPFISGRIKPMKDLEKKEVLHPTTLIIPLKGSQHDN